MAHPTCSAHEEQKMLLRSCVRSECQLLLLGAFKPKGIIASEAVGAAEVGIAEVASTDLGVAVQKFAPLLFAAICLPEEQVTRPLFDEGGDEALRNRQHDLETRNTVMLLAVGDIGVELHLQKLLPQGFGQIFAPHVERALVTFLDLLVLVQILGVGCHDLMAILGVDLLVTTHGEGEEENDGEIIEQLFEAHD